MTTNLQFSDIKKETAEMEQYEKVMVELRKLYGLTKSRRALVAIKILEGKAK